MNEMFLQEERLLFALERQAVNPRVLRDPLMDG